MVTAFLIALSSLFLVSSVIPYLIGVIRGKTKPRIVSWFIWGLLAAIASAASFADNQLPSGFLLLTGAIQCSLVVILGFKNGDRHFEMLDVMCFIGAMMGLVLWLVFNSPAITIIATITIDLLGTIPTAKHAWQKPHEETLITFILGALGAGITAAIVDGWSIMSAAYPVYLFVAQAIITGLIIFSPHRRRKGEPPMLRDM